MKTFCAAVAAVLALAAGSAAQATVLTFDGLTSTYYGFDSLPAGLTGDFNTVTYTQDGFQLTLHAPNAGYGAHIGDATYTPDTFNYHNDGDNGYAPFATLTKLGGGTFNLLSFDYFSGYEEGFTISAAGHTSYSLVAGASGTSSPNWSGVTSVTFATTAYYNSNQLDNISVSSAPEPASWALMIGGFGLAGAALRRRRAVPAAA